MSLRRRTPPLDPDDLLLWERATADVAPLHRHRALRPPDPPRPKPEPAPARRTVAPPAPPPKPPRAPSASGPLEKHLRRRIDRGSEPIAARLDLHGMRQDEAHRALSAFVLAAHRRGDRVVLVITGKGAPGGSAASAGERGVLRRAVPAWLRLPPCVDLVAGVEPAHRNHGGSGALYVQLRRPRGEALL